MFIFFLCLLLIIKTKKVTTNKVENPEGKVSHNSPDKNMAETLNTIEENQEAKKDLIIKSPEKTVKASPKKMEKSGLKDDFDGFDPLDNQEKISEDFDNEYERDIQRNQQDKEFEAVDLERTDEKI